MSQRAQSDFEPEPSVRGVQKQRNLKLAIVGGGILATVVVAGVVISTTLDRKAQAKLEDNWAQLSHCLVGGPVANSQAAVLRFRNTQLTAMALAPDKRSEAGAMPWPARCSLQAHSVAEAWKDAGKASKDPKDLAASAEELAKLLKDTNTDPVLADLSTVVGQVWDAASVAKLTPGNAGSGPILPKPAAPLTLDDFKGKAPISKQTFGLKNVFDSALAGDTIHFLVEDRSVPEAPFLCTITASEGRCKKLASVLATQSGLRLLAATDDGAEPLVFAGNQGSEGIYRSGDGTLITKMYSYGGNVAADGHVSLIGWEPSKRELHVVRQPRGGSSTTWVFKPKLSVANYFYSTAMLGDHVVMRGVDKERLVLVSHPLQREGDALGAMTEIGAIDQGGPSGEGGPHVTGCRTKETVVAKVEGFRDEFLTFFKQGKFSPPVTAPGRGGILTCRGSEAALTQGTVQTIYQVRCTSAGCQEATAKGEEIFGKDKALAPRDGWMVGADVDGKLLIIWAAGERGGLRMRLAPVEQIGKTEDVVLYDDLVQDGKAAKLSTAVEMKLMARGTYSVLLLSTMSGVQAIRVTADGKLTPIPLAIDG